MDSPLLALTQGRLSLGKKACPLDRWVLLNLSIDNQGLYLLNPFIHVNAMYTRIYWIEPFDKGNLGIMPRPSGHEHLKEEILRLKKLGADVLVSLLTASEISEMGLKKESELCQEQQINFINFPIEDRQVPVSSEPIQRLAEHIDNALSEGKKVLIHCRGGIGRVTLY